MLRNEAADILIKYGVTPELKGFKYICDAVEIISSDNNVKTMELYSMIASMNHDEPDRVERSLRHAIGKMSDEGLKELKMTGCRANSKFLYSFVFRLGGRYGRNE